MQQLESKAHETNGVIFFNSIKNGGATYKRLVVSNQQERPYDIVMFMNLLPESQIERDLKHLIQAEEQFHQVNYSYKKFRNHERPVFFGVMYYDTNDSDIYDLLKETHEYLTIPWLTVSTKNFDDRIDERFIQKHHEWNILGSEAYSGMKQLEFVNNALKVDVPFKMTLKQLLVSNALIVAVLATLVFLVVFCYKQLLNQWLWFAIAITVWVFSLAGFVAVRMDKPDKWLSHTDDDGVEIIDSYINEGYRDVYAYEGYFFSGTVTLMGLCFIAILNVPKFLSNRLVQDIVIVLLMVIIYLGYNFLMTVMNIKRGYYNPQIVPNDDLMKGSLLEN